MRVVIAGTHFCSGLINSTALANNIYSVSAIVQMLVRSSADFWKPNRYNRKRPEPSAQAES